jgi:CRP/FNR family cyclic AMP-dependent transcriptional regulator
LQIKEFDAFCIETPRGLEAGKEATVSLMAAQHFIGEESLAGAAGLHAASAIAITPSIGLKISRQEMINMLHNEDEFSDMFLKFVVNRAIRTTRRSCRPAIQQ